MPLPVTTDSQIARQRSAGVKVETLIDAADLPENERLSLQEMSRIMDVATTLRKERVQVDQQLNLDQIKAQLRERLLEAARVSGDAVTSEEIDAAVEQYYDRLHEFAEPAFGWRTGLAHLWVRRGPIMKGAFATASVMAVIWGLLVAGMLPGERRERRLATARYAEIERKVASIEELSRDPETAEETATLLASARSFLDQNQASQLDALAEQLGAMHVALALDYTVSVLANPNSRSGIEREFSDEGGTRTSGYYVFVEALDSEGMPVRVPIVNRETGRTERVSRWGEQIPLAVFERLASDKQSDGVLDERTFGRKRRGLRHLEVEMKDAQGEPIVRQGQITHWE